MPASFPEQEFRAFGVACDFWGHLLDDKNLFDPLEKQRNFQWAWQAVRYRYRTCFETAEEFKALLADPSSAWWRAGGNDEELVYKLEHCIYEFFTNGLSVFESFCFALYFFGEALKPAEFPHAATPRKITPAATAKAFTQAFPGYEITTALAQLLRKPQFIRIDRIRNLLAHRVSGRRSVRGGTDGATQWREETWHIPGADDPLQFSGAMLGALLDEITSMLTALITPARQFAETQKSTALVT